MEESNLSIILIAFIRIPLLKYVFLLIISNSDSDNGGFSSFPPESSDKIRFFTLIVSIVNEPFFKFKLDFPSESLIESLIRSVIVHLEIVSFRFFLAKLDDGIPFKYSELRFLTKLVEFILKGASNVVIVKGVVKVVFI